MKKLSTLIAAVIAVCVAPQAYAQASSSNAVEERQPASSQHPHKKLKTHGKRAAVSESASAAGTSDKGTQN